MTLAELRAKREDIAALASDYGASGLRVFGSVARGDARADSDVDLLVDLESGLGLRFFELRERLTELVGCRVDLVADGPVLREGRRALEAIRREAVPL